MPSLLSDINFADDSPIEERTCEQGLSLQIFHLFAHDKTHDNTEMKHQFE